MWLLDKVRSPSPPEEAPLSTSPAGPFANILTPDRIPAFCIPPRLPPAPPPPPKGPGPAFLPHRCLSETGLQAKAPENFPPHLIQVESVEEEEEEEEEVDPEEEEEEEEEGTDSDPRSQAALSLPHFQKAQTSYGFCTLLESPHTRRKESIFHGEGPLVVPPRSRSSSYGGRELTLPVPVPGPPFRRKGGWDSDTTASSSSESSPLSSPRLRHRCGSLFKAWSHDGLLGKTLRTRSGWMRAGRAGSLSAGEGGGGGSSTDSSPNATRRSSESLFGEPSPRSFGVPLDLERRSGESVIAMGPAALVRLSSEYCPQSRRLRVRLISAEGLYPASTDPKGIHCCVSLALEPGKIQKQRSTGIKRSRNPIFKEDFFFVGVAQDDLRDLALRIKALNKGGGVRRDLVLGESRVALDNLLAA